MRLRWILRLIEHGNKVKLRLVFLVDGADRKLHAAPLTTGPGGSGGSARVTPQRGDGTTAATRQDGSRQWTIGSLSFRSDGPRLIV